MSMRRFKVVVGLAAAAACWLVAARPAAAQRDIAWDRVENVKAAARQIGELQAQSGVERAFKFVSDCYKTHSLASKYSKSFEGCIAQDYMLSRTLKEIYAQVPGEALSRMGAPSPAQIDNAFNARVLQALDQYKRPKSDAQVIARLAEQHGMPVFLATVFPKSAADNKSSPDKASPDKAGPDKSPKEKQ